MRSAKVALSQSGLLSALQRPIAFHKVFAQISGSVTAGLFLSQLFYWHDKGSDPDGWIYKTYADWTEETTMSRKELDTARRKLRALGVLEESLHNVPATVHYRINFDRLIELLNEHAKGANLIDQKGQTSLSERGKLDCPKGANYHLYTEITTETTASGAVDAVGTEDPFFLGQAKQIAREVAKQTKQPATKNFLTDSPWGELARELDQDPKVVWEEFDKFMLAVHSDKKDPEAYVGKVLSSLFQNPGTELANKHWVQFAKHFRKNLSAPPVAKKAERRQPQLVEIPDRIASAEAIRRARHG